MSSRIVPLAQHLAPQLLALLFTAGCGANQVQTSSAADVAGSADAPQNAAAPEATGRPEVAEANPCIAQVLATYEREAALACLFEVDKPGGALVEMDLQNGTRDKVRSKFGAAGDAKLEPVLAVIDRTMTDEALRSRMQGGITAGLTDAQLKDVLRHAASPIGRLEATLLEANLEGDIDSGAFEAWFEDFDEDGPRSDALTSYCVDTGVAGVAELMFVPGAAGMALGIAAASNPPNLPSEETLREQLSGHLEPAIDELRGTLCAMLFYSVRHMTDAELAQAHAYYKSESGAAYTALQVETADHVLFDAFHSVGTALGPIAKGQ